MKKTIGSSIICMDHINFDREVRLAAELGIDYLHVDMMDGKFVPRFGIYPEIVRRIADVCCLPMDVHLMVENIPLAIEELKSINTVEYVSFHLGENKHNALRIIDKIKSCGKKAGLVLNLATDIRDLEWILESNDLSSIMFMGIHPGVLKQESRPELVIKKLKAVAPLIYDKECATFVQVDGGVSFDTAPKLLDAGANNLVCGSSTLYQGVNALQNRDEVEKKITVNYQKLRALMER